MEIRNKAQHDPVTDIPMVEAYKTWALKAAEEVVGKQGLTIILRENGLERFIDCYPSENLVLSKDIIARDYADLCTGLCPNRRPGRYVGLSICNVSDLRRKGI